MCNKFLQQSLLILLINKYIIVECVINSPNNTYSLIIFLHGTPLVLFWYYIHPAPTPDKPINPFLEADRLQTGTLGARAYARLWQNPAGETPHVTPTSLPIALSF